MAENNALDLIVDEIAESAKKKSKHLFIGISEGDASEKLIAFSEKQGEVRLLRMNDKTIFFITDTGKERLVDQFDVVHAHGLYMTPGVPPGIIDERVVSRFEQSFCAIRTLHNIPEKEFNIDERVQCHGEFGVVIDVKWGFHNRGGKFCWKYKIVWEGKGPNLSIIYLPEGYLQKEGVVDQVFYA